MPAATKTTAKKPKKNLKKTNLLRLYNHMQKLTEDAVDNEIMKRFKVLIDANEEDLPKSDIDSLLNSPENSEAGSFPEGLQPYVKHFLFMNKRAVNRKKKAESKNEN